MEQMRDNPNFMDQMNEWQRARNEKGEDPMDWGAFRDHLTRIGAPDPGGIRPDEFSAYMDSMGGAAAGATATADETSGAESAESPPNPNPGS